jgi:hypothetical protein
MKHKTTRQPQPLQHRGYSGTAYFDEYELVYLGHVIIPLEDIEDGSSTSLATQLLEYSAPDQQGLLIEFRRRVDTLIKDQYIKDRSV